MYQTFGIMGRLTDHPTLKLTSAGTPFVDFTIAHDRDYKATGGEKVTDFFKCVAWRGTAEFLDKYFTKGQLILIEGRMEMQRYTDKEGNNRVSAVVNVDKVHFTGDNRNKEEKQNYGFEQEPTPAGFSELESEIPF